tara:strand:+ start:2826 stop:4298 length:1473 start_codon:yes stop_codon:yes gene_type:complete
LSNHDLLLKPYWNAKDLGKAIPNSPHAVSVALPRWQDVIDYEEKKESCMQSLRAIYPRFGLNPLVAEIAKKATELAGYQQGKGWPYPNSEIAKQAQLFCQSQNTGEAIIQDVLGLKCLITDQKASSSAKEFWQHTGFGASSRLAAIALNKEVAPSKNEGETARVTLINRLAEIYGCEDELIQLYPSGMAALTAGLTAIRRIRSKNSFLQIGFPYVDVLKLPQKIFGGSRLIQTEDPEELAITLDSQQPAAVIVELPSNPMMQCVDLPTISKLAHARGIPVIADDTIGSAINIESLPYADIVFSSLTKSFAGVGDILAGSMIISPYSYWKKDLFEINLLANSTLPPLSDPDAIALEKASRDVLDRIPMLNSACLKLKRKLEQHPKVSRVLHPEHCSNFNSIKKKDAGYGCLLSFQLIESANPEHFYDSLQVCKGPSLGTNFTLACPYVLLAHYEELSWAKGCGVPPNLLRVSVGLEEPQSLWARFEKAFRD